MNKYESVIIMKPETNKKIEVLDKINKIINKEGNLEKTDDLGNKKLAYEVKGNKEGYYIVFYFNVEDTIIDKLEKYYRSEEEILKFIIVKMEEFDYE